MKRLVLVVWLSVMASYAVTTCTWTAAASTLSMSTTTGADWSCGHVPGTLTDDVIVGLDGKTLNIDVATSLGDSASPTTPSILPKAAGTGGTFIVNITAPFTSRAYMRQGNANWTVDCRSPKTGSVLLDHASTALIWIANDTTTIGNAAITVRGSSFGACRIGSVNTAKGYIQNTIGGNNATAILDVDGAWFDSLGVNGGQDAYFAGTRAAGTNMSILNSKNVGGGKIGWEPGANESFTVDHYYTDGAFYTKMAPASRTRIISNSYIQGGYILQSSSVSTSNQTGFGVTMSNTILANSSGCPFSIPVSQVVEMPMTNVVLFAGSDACPIPAGTHTNIIGLLQYSSAVGNVDLMSTANPWQGSLTNVIGQQWNLNAVTTPVGDYFNIRPNAVATNTISVRNLVGLPGKYTSAGTRGGGFKTMSICTSTDQSTITIDMANVTWIPPTTSAEGVTVFEAATTPKVGLFPSVKNVIGVYPFSASTVGMRMTRVNTGSVAVGSWTTIGYANIVRTSFQIYSDPQTLYTNPPGTGDFTDDPLLVDATRDLLSWDQQYSPSDTTWAQVLAHMNMTNSTTFDSRYAITNAISWIQWGMIPSNPKHWANGASGGYMGGVDPTPVKLIMAAGII